MRFEVFDINDQTSAGCDGVTSQTCGMRIGVIADVFEADKSLQWNCTTS